MKHATRAARPQLTCSSVVKTPLKPLQTGGGHVCVHRWHSIFAAVNDDDHLRHALKASTDCQDNGFYSANADASESVIISM